MGKVLAFILSIPILVFGIVFDVIKAPIILLFIAPIWLFLDLISVLRGEDAIAIRMIGEILIMGYLIWCDVSGFPEPKWCN